jgi:hypothetical protein
MVWPTSAEEGLSPPTDGSLCTVRRSVPFVTWKPSRSVTAIDMEKLPAAVAVQFSGSAFKATQPVGRPVQTNEYPPEPPEVTAESEVVCPWSTEPGLTVGTETVGSA